jgi:hypothetical protein
MDGGEGGFLGLSPSTFAILLIVVALCLYVAYQFYYGRATVPSPAYFSGFKGSQGFLGGRFKTAGFEDASGAPQKKEGFLGNALASLPVNESAPLNTTDRALQNVKEGFQRAERGGCSPSIKEGFGGAARGTGSPDCLRSSAEGAELIAMFQGRNSSFEEGSDDLRELTQIVSKLSCFKKDLVSPSYIVEATRYQQFVTMHDIEPIAETTGRCFSKTISPRDLEIAFDKWSQRGELLVRRLCTEYQLSNQDVNKVQALFRAVLRDVKDIARGACLQGEPKIAGKPGPRDAHPYEAPGLQNLGEYSGYY